MKKKLQQVYAMLSAMSVSGDAVDIVAGMRSLLRDCIQEVENGGQTDKQPSGGNKR